MIRRLASLVFAATLLASCTAGPPDDAESPVVESSLLQLDTVAADQIEHTAEAAAVPVPTEPESKAQLASPPAPKAKPKPVAPPPPTNNAPAPAPAAPPAPSPASTAPDHAAWNNLLTTFVSASGKVDYRGMKQQVGKLDGYLALLAKETPGANWSREESLAYWINAYNAYTVKLVLDNYPLKSIRDLGEPWDRKWITLAGKTYSLNQIEHDIVRPTFKEPRIHFALVCAAKSCPPLPNRAFTAENLNQLLQQRAKSFINNEELNVTQEEVVRVSPLFDWYKQDFGNVREYLNKYLATDIPAGKDISYLDYDWGLNE